MPRLAKVTRPFPMRIPLRAGQIVDLDDWRYADAYIRKGNFAELTEKESKEFLASASGDQLQNIRIASVPFDKYDTSGVKKLSEKEVENLDAEDAEELAGQKSKKGEEKRESENATSRIGVEPKDLTAESIPEAKAAPVKTGKTKARK